MAAQFATLATWVLSLAEHLMLQKLAALFADH